MILVLDACAMIAFLREEPGADIVSQYVEDVNNLCMAHAINLCEVYYDFIRAVGERQSVQALADLEAVGIIERNDLDRAFWQEAGEYKATLKRISIADCFALALTKRVGGALLTSDHREFGPIAAQGICPVIFFR